MINKDIRGSYSRRIKAAIEQYARDGKVQLPYRIAPSSVKNWSIHKCMEFLASQNMKPVDFGITDEIQLEPTGTALAAESAAIQLARALAELHDIRQNIEEILAILKE